MNFDQTNGLPAVRITEVSFSYPAGATDIVVSMRTTRVLRDASGVEHEIAGAAEMHQASISTASMGDLVALHDVKTGEPSGQSIPRGGIVAAINSLCRGLIAPAA